MTAVDVIRVSIGAMAIGAMAIGARPVLACQDDAPSVLCRFT